MTHHNLDIYPVPKDKNPLYVNEPWLMDATLLEQSSTSEQPESEADNVRIYLPLDLNKSAILRRLDMIISHYGAASEANELNFQRDVDMLIAQLEIYDQVWFARHMPKQGTHSREAIDLAGAFVKRLEAIPDACAELLPFETIAGLQMEYLGITEESAEFIYNRI